MFPRVKCSVLQGFEPWSEVPGIKQRLNMDISKRFFGEMRFNAFKVTVKICRVELFVELSYSHYIMKNCT